MESGPDMITRQELDESLLRVMNNLLLEMKMRSEHTDAQFAAVRADIADIRTRLDRQAGLLQSVSCVMLRVDRWA